MLYAILISGLFTALRFVLTQLVIKFILFFAVYLLAGEVADFAANLLGSDTATPLATLQGFNLLPEGSLYFLDLFYVIEGSKAVLAAMLAMFALRRIPFFGK